MARYLPRESTVLVTRPKEQSQILADLIAQAGAKAVVAPMIGIESTGATLDAHARDALGDARSTSIFLSPNSVRFGLNESHPVTLAGRILAMGDATATALRNSGYAADATPIGGIDSEALLRHPLMGSLENRKFIVFQGEGGRGVVQQALVDGGARLFTHVCYRRTKPELSVGDFGALWRVNRPTDCIISSATALENLLELAGDLRPHVLSTRFVVMGQRLARVARDMGVSGPVSIATSASDEGLLAALFDASD